MNKFVTTMVAAVFIVLGGCLRTIEKILITRVPMRNYLFGCVFFGAMFLIVGCTPPVKIEQPTAGVQTKPVRTFTVRFDTAYVPGTFQADLSGVTITSLFQPVPVPGGVSTAAITYPQFMDYNFMNSVNGSGKPNEQLLRVSGQSSSNASCCDSVKFSPPSIRIYRGGGATVTFDHDISLKERETITATVFVDTVPQEALTVRVTGHPSVSLNEQPAGMDITLVVPSNDRRADFRIRGIVVTGEYFHIRAIADGFASDWAGGAVKPAS